MWGVGALAFGEQFIALTYNSLLRLLRPKRGVYRHSQYSMSIRVNTESWSDALENLRAD
jgi:hypothetical protein